MTNPRDLEARVATMTRGTAAPLSLLGGGDDARLRRWEVMKGITAPAEFRLVARRRTPAGAPGRTAKEMAVRAC
ncbi:hypothetical protein ACTG9Q_27050 [Actinokineospora sp. 24-640]